MTKRMGSGALAATAAVVAVALGLGLARATQIGPIDLGEVDWWGDHPHVPSEAVRPQEVAEAR